MDQLRVGGSCCGPLNDKTLSEVSGVFMEARQREGKKKKRQSLLEHPSSSCLPYT